MGPGGFLGLQIQCRVVIPAVVGSIPTRSRQIEKYRRLNSLNDYLGPQKNTGGASVE